tara:strand:- start:6773 stop:8206 length:1434 start_codon:yes stop_codon:yes gene_type:complete
METVKQNFSGSAAADKTVVATISRNGDLVGRMCVTSKTSGKTGGSDLVKSAEVEIGGQKIDKQTSEWMKIWNELSTPESKAVGLKAMAGDIGTTGSDGVTTVQVPLQFWFNRNPGLALPLIALQYHEVKVKIELGDSNTGSDKAELDADYIYLDTDERRRFAQVSHEYLIEQVQEENAKGSNNTSTLNFNHPVKELIWTNEGTNYTDAKLVLNGHDRFAAQPAEYFQLRQPMNHHTAVPRQNLPVSAQLSTLDRQTQFGTINEEGTNATNDGALSVELDGATAAGSDGTLFYDHSAGTINMEAAGTAANPANATNAGSLRKGDQIAIVVTVASASGKAGLLGRVYFATLTADSSVPGTGGATDSLLLSITVPTSTDTGTTDAFSVDTDATGKYVVYKVTNGNSAQARTSKMTKKINVYSFALKPEEHQPSGTCNFSRIDNAQLVTTGTQLDAADTIYAVNYNVLRVMSGMGGLAYSN